MNKAECIGCGDDLSSLNENNHCSDCAICLRDGDFSILSCFELSAQFTKNLTDDELDSDIYT